MTDVEHQVLRWLRKFRLHWEGPICLTFAQDRFVPCFDTRYDTCTSVRARSSMLFDAICTVGCRAEHGL